jgi:hypothetical protein
MLIVVCHFVISCLSFFRFMYSDHLFWYLHTFPTYQTLGSPRSGIGDLSQVWQPWLDICELSQVWLPWLDIGDHNQVGLPWLDIGDLSQVWLPWIDIGDLSQVWLPWLNIIDRRHVWLPLFDIGDLSQVLLPWLDIGDLSQDWLPWLDIGDLSQVWLPWLDILMFLIPMIEIRWFTICWLWVYPLKVIAETLICYVFFCDCSFCWYWRNCSPQFLFLFSSHLKSLNIHKINHWTYIFMLYKLQHGIK